MKLNFFKEPNYIEIDSSIIHAVLYDYKTCSLIVKFRGEDKFGNEQIYLYAGIPPSVYEKFINAESKGGHLNQYFDAYPYLRINN